MKLFWKVDENGLKNEKLHISHLTTLKNDPEKSEIIIMLDRLNSKSSNLLQHVSIMIAILSVFFAVNVGNDAEIIIFRYAILTEIMAYSIISLGCLRVNWMAGSEDMPSKEYVEYFFKVSVRRRRIYKLCFVATIMITSIFIITLWWRYIDFKWT